MATLRDWAKQQGLDVTYDDKTKQVKVGNLSFASGQGGQYGINSNAGTNYVGDETALKQALGLSQPVGQPQQGLAPNNNQDVLAQMQNYYNSQLAAQKQSLINSMNEQVAAKQGQRADVTQQAVQQRTTANTSAQLYAQRLRETLANMGLLNSGSNITAQGRLNTAYQQQLANIGTQEQQAQNQISQDIANLKTASKGDIAQMNQALAAEQARAMWDQMNADRGYNYQMGRDQIADQRYQQEWSWQTNPSNPANQARMLQNQIAQLELEFLPQQQALELQRLKQSIANGQIDYDTAREKLNQLRNPQQTAPSTSLDVQDFIRQIDSLYPQYDKATDLANDPAIRKRNIITYIRQLYNSGVDESTLADIARAFGLSQWELESQVGR